MEIYKQNFQPLLAKFDKKNSKYHFLGAGESLGLAITVGRLIAGLTVGGAEAGLGLAVGVTGFATTAGFLKAGAGFGVGVVSRGGDGGFVGCGLSPNMFFWLHQGHIIFSLVLSGNWILNGFLQC